MWTHEQEEARTGVWAPLIPKSFFFYKLETYFIRFEQVWLRQTAYAERAPMDGWTDRWLGGRMDGRSDGQKDKRTEGRSDGWTDGRTLLGICAVVGICSPGTDLEMGHPQVDP